MNPRRLFIAIGVALVGLVAFNVLLHLRTRGSERQRLRALIEHLPPTDVLFLGNSLMEAGCDVDAFNAAWPKTTPLPRALNLGLGASTPVEHYLILQRLLQSGARPKYLVYGFFDDLLTISVSSGWSDLVGNRAIAYYVPEAAAEFIAPGSRLKRWEMATIARVPIIAERWTLWTQVELMRRRMQQVGLAQQESNRFGRVSDFDTLAAQNLEGFNQRCARVLATQQDFSRPIREMVNLARRHDLKIIFVEMPLSARHRGVYHATPVWPEAHAYFLRKIAEDGAIHLAATDWIADDRKFEDAMHLSPAGAKEFSARLASALAQLGVRGEPAANR